MTDAEWALLEPLLPRPANRADHALGRCGKTLGLAQACRCRLYENVRCKAAQNARGHTAVPHPYPYVFGS